MMVGASPSFSPRACPHCGSDAKHTLLRVTSAAIFRSNWSYRESASADLAAAEDDTFPIERCRNCGFVYAGLLPDADFLAAVYDRVIDTQAARRHNLSPANLASKMVHLSTLLRLLPNEDSQHRVLDFGCGFGPGLEVLRGMPGVTAIGYETSEARLKDLRARGLVATGDIQKLQTQAPFAAIILDNVLEHVPSPRDAVATIARLAAPDCVLYVSVPDIGCARIVAQQAAATRQEAIPMDINPWEHLNYFDISHLDQLLADVCFKSYPAAALPNPVDIGLRPLRSGLARFKNGLASVPRLFSYLARGEAMASVTGRFYRREA